MSIILNISDSSVEIGEIIMATKGERTREHILEVSYGLFARWGFQRITMKDVCDASGLSRGGLYSHFSSTAEIFEAVLAQMEINLKLDFYDEIQKKIPAVEILERALTMLEEEMQHPEDSLSLAMYEYAISADSSVMEEFVKSSTDKWKAFIQYGIDNGEFNNVPVDELVIIIMNAYQGVRMWSRIITMTPEYTMAVTKHIRRQLIP